MKNFIQICSICLFVVFAVTFSNAKSKPTTRTKLNKDGSLLKIVEKSDQTDRHISIYFSQNRKSKPKKVLTLEQYIDDAPSGGAGFFDIDNDGFYEIEVQGMCGGANCEGTIYKLDRKSGSLYEFFSGGYYEIFVLEDYLIESGRNGCCGWEYHAYKIEENNQKLLVGDNMAMMISVNVEGDGKGNIKNVSCSFGKSVGGEFELINPPSKKWLKLCENYGKKYELVRPE